VGRPQYGRFRAKGASEGGRDESRPYRKTGAVMWGSPSRIGRTPEDGRAQVPPLQEHGRGDVGESVQAWTDPRRWAGTSPAPTGRRAW